MTARPIIAFVIGVVLLLGMSVGLQLARDRRYPTASIESSFLYVPSGAVLRRVALSFDALLADVYWIRAIQHYGSTKLIEGEDKSFALLYPLLDITTALDPRFNIAYRFGSIFLAEAYPDGPGQPTQAIALLEKGVRAMPDKWQYLMDIGFVHYWWLHDYEASARWFQKASQVPGAPWWLESMAATTLTQGGQRLASRQLWQQMLESSDNEWLQNEASRRLLQLTALDQIDQLREIIDRYRAQQGHWPDTWAQVVQAGLLRGTPLDPTQTPYRLERETDEITVDGESRLFPLPTEPPRLVPAAP